MKIFTMITMLFALALPSLALAAQQATCTSVVDGSIKKTEADKAKEAEKAAEGQVQK